MKKKIALLVFCVVALPFAAIAEVIEVTVKGMVCSFCAQGIQKTLGKQAGVKTVDVNMESKVVKIETEKGGDLPDEKLKELISDAGYNVMEIKRK